MNESFWTSDTHFWHKRICELAGRPFDSVEEMNETLIENWNERVQKSDRVFHLGDFSFGSREQTGALIPRLKGQIHLIQGNHDDVLKRFKDRFTSYSTYKEVRIDEQKIVMSHYPMVVWHQSHRGGWMLHGHCHGNLQDDPNALRWDVGVDPNGYRPLSFEELKEIMSKKTFVPLDHHVAD